MKNFVFSFFRTSAFANFMIMMIVVNVSGQQTISVTTNKSGVVNVNQSALPILNEKPFQNKNKTQTSKSRDKISVLTDKPAENSTGQRENFFCSTPNSFEKPRGNFDIKAVGALDCGSGGNTPCYWTKPFILVGFINGTPELKQVVREVIAEWTTWANVGFIVDENSNFSGDSADIKISFNSNGRHNSYVGIDSWHRSVRTGKNEPTMNLGYLNRQLRSSDGEVLSWVKGTILHEFGHALGLQHEHQNPAGGIQWNRDAVITDLSGPPNNWTVDIIESNIFRALSRSRTQFTQWDPSSIMHYSFPAGWTQNGIAIPENDDLSETDKSFIAGKYPRRKASIDTSQYYRLTTWHNNRVNCLGLGYNQTESGKVYFPYYFACSNANRGQLWKFTKQSNGDYRLTNYLTGDQSAMSDPGLEYYTNMRPVGNYSNQYWTVTSIDKYYHLSSMLNGTYYSLTAETAPDTRPSMSQTAHWSNQLWEFVPAGKIQ